MDWIRTVWTHTDVFEMRRPIEVCPQRQAMCHLPTRNGRRVLYAIRREFYKEADAGTVSRIASATDWNEERIVDVA